MRDEQGAFTPRAFELEVEKPFQGLFLAAGKRVPLGDECACTGARPCACTGAGRASQGYSSWRCSTTRCPRWGGPRPPDQ